MAWATVRPSGIVAYSVVIIPPADSSGWTSNRRTYLASSSSINSSNWALDSGGRSASRSAASSGSISSNTSAARSRSNSSSTATCNSGSISSRVSAMVSLSRAYINSRPVCRSRSLTISAMSAGCSLLIFSREMRSLTGASACKGATTSQEMIVWADPGLSTERRACTGRSIPSRRNNPRPPTSTPTRQYRSRTRANCKSFTRTTRRPSMSTICRSRTWRPSHSSSPLSWYSFNSEAFTVSNISGFSQPSCSLAMKCGPSWPLENAKAQIGGYTVSTSAMSTSRHLPILSP